jgi:hypothetical protein
MKTYEGKKDIHIRLSRFLNNTILVPDELIHDNMYITPHTCHTQNLNKTCWRTQKTYTHNFSYTLR